MDYLIRKAVPADADGITYVHIESWKTTYPGLIPEVIIEKKNYKRRLELWRTILSTIQNNPNIPDSQVYVAISNEDFNHEIKNGMVIGFIQGGKTRSPTFDYDAEIYVMYLLKPAQRKGIGSCLFTEIMKFLKTRNYSQALLWVLKDNPAEQFYSRMGGIPKEIKIDEREGYQLREIGYAWNIADNLS